MEQEIKIKIENPEELISKLTALKAEKIGQNFQRTTRMDTPNMDLEKNGTFLRVRTGYKNTVTLKKHLKESSKEVFEREEIETEVKDTNKLADIFANLGFTKRLIMEKYRMDFKYKDLTISIDELPFGFYVELEGEPEEIFKVAKELDFDIANKIMITYWDLFEEYKKQNNVQGENIIFPENYKSKLLE